MGDLERAIRESRQWLGDHRAALEAGRQWGEYREEHTRE